MVPLGHPAVPLRHPAVPLGHLAVPLGHLVVPLRHLVVPLRHLAVPFGHLVGPFRPSRLWHHVLFILHNLPMPFESSVWSIASVGTSFDVDTVVGLTFTTG